MSRDMTLLISRVVEHFSQASIATTSLLLMILIVSAASMLSIWRLMKHQRQVSNDEDSSGESAVKCLAEYSARRTIVTIHKIQKRTKNDWMMSERRVISQKSHQALRWLVLATRMRISLSAAYRKRRSAVEVSWQSRLARSWPLRLTSSTRCEDLRGVKWWFYDMRWQNRRLQWLNSASRRTPEMREVLRCEKCLNIDD